MNGADVAPQTFFAHVLEGLETRFKLLAGHVHHFEDSTSFVAIRVGITRIDDSKPRPIKRVFSLSHREDLMLRATPLNTHRCITPSSWHIQNYTMIAIRIMQLRVIF